MNYLTELLKSTHRKDLFSCGKELLDHYLYHQAHQDGRKKLAACFVMVDPTSGLIKGFYTLSNNSIPFINIPPEFSKRFPKTYSQIPVTLLGRFAIDRRFRGKGEGKLLLIDALRRSYESSKTIGSFAVVVDPIDQEAEAFYSKYGFILLPDSKKMFLPMKTIAYLFE